MTEVELKEWGNSIGVIMPADLLKEMGLRKGDIIDIDIVKKKMVDGFGICRGAHPFREEDTFHSDL